MSGKSWRFAIAVAVLWSASSLAASAQPAVDAGAEARQSGRWRVSAKRVRQARFRSFTGSTFEELSAYLYAGETSFASKLRLLNKPGFDPASARVKPVRYSPPLLRVESGETLQEIGFIWGRGRAGSFQRVVTMNSRIKDADHVLAGTWIELERVPSEAEREERRRAWELTRDSRGGTGGNGAAAGPQGSEKVRTERIVLKSMYEPFDATERLELARFYLSRPSTPGDAVSKRSQAIAKDLAKDPNASHDALFVAGKYAFDSDSFAQARDWLARAVRSRDARLETALLYLQATRAAGTELPADELEGLHERFPELQAIEAMMKRGTEAEAEATETQP